MSEKIEMPKLVIVESPYRGNGYSSLDLNLRYGRACMRDSFLRGEFPFGSHLLYTQEGILDDKKPEERRLGINAGLAWGQHADLTAVYLDLIGEWKHFVGIANGVKVARRTNRPVEFRNLSDEILNSLDIKILARKRKPEILIAELETFLPTLKSID